MPDKAEWIEKRYTSLKKTTTKTKLHVIAISEWIRIKK